MTKFWISVFSLGVIAMMITSSFQAISSVKMPEWNDLQGNISEWVSVDFLSNSEVVPMEPHLAAIVEQLEERIETNLATTKAPGCALAIVKDGKIAYEKGFGIRNVISKEPVDEHTVFRLASVSKGFAGVLTGILSQQNKLDWEDRVVDYTSGFELKKTNNTNALQVKHILNHTSGLPRHAYTDLIEDCVSYEDMRLKLQDVDLIGKPGQHYAYQNVAYSLIGDVVLGATKKDYSTLLEEKIFKPFGMKDASATYEGIMYHDNVAQPHVLRRGKWYADHIDETYYEVIPAAGVNASIHDMANYMIALLGHQKYIKSSTLDEIFKPTTDIKRMRRYRNPWKKLDKVYYAMGWRIITYKDGTQIMYHGGHVNGYRAEIAFDRQADVGIVYLSNYSPNYLSNDILPKFFSKYYAPKKETQQAAVPVEP